jgi:hypothetical protein
MQVNINLSGQQQQQQQGSAWPVAPATLPPGAAAAAAGCKDGELQRLSQRMSTSMNINDTHGACGGVMPYG